MGSGFKGSKATPASWVTLGAPVRHEARDKSPEAFAHRVRDGRISLTRASSAREVCTISELRPPIFWVLTACAALRAAGQIFFKEGSAGTLNR